MRRAFDQAFAHPPLARAKEDESFLAVRLGGDAYAIRLIEVAELFKDRNIVRMPSRRSDFLGLAGLRGGIVPVHSLQRLLGYSGANEKTRWLLLAAPGHSVAFAVDQFEGHLRVDRSEILPASTNAIRAHLSEVARVKDEPRPIISLRSVLQGLQERHGLVGTQF
jgi:purine-binding chemotaxis protein CheW